MGTAAGAQKAPAQAPVLRQSVFASPTPGIRWRPERRLVFVAVAPDSGAITPTHWLEGGIIGGATAGLGLAVLGDLLCHGLNENSSVSCAGTTIGIGLVGATAGFVIGSLIGGAFPKH